VLATDRRVLGRVTHNSFFNPPPRLRHVLTLFGNDWRRSLIKYGDAD